MASITNIAPGAPFATHINPTCKYEMVITFMHGDADQYTTSTFLFGVDDPNLIKLYNVFNNISKYSDMSTKSCWNAYLVTQTIDDDMLDTVLDMLERDMFTDGDLYASVDSVSVAYFDESGIKCRTILTV